MTGRADLTRTLVTGGAGYLGELTVRQLQARGDAVRVFDLRAPDDPPPGVEVLQGDVRDLAAVTRAMAGVDVVHHQVAQVPLAKDPHLLWTVNVDGTENVLRAAAAAGVRKVVLVSSSAVYGIPATVPITEATVPKPVEAYGRAKLAGEQAALTWRTRGLDIAIVRPRTVLGHGRLGIFQILFEWARTGRPLWLLGSGQNRYQFVHADDLVDLCLRAEKPGQGLYLGGAAEFGTLRELLTHLAQHAGAGSAVRSLPIRSTQAVMGVTARLGLSPLAPYHAAVYSRDVWFDLGGTTAALDWRPVWSNRAMITQSYDWYVAHRAEVMGRAGSSPHRSPLPRGVLRVLEYWK